MNLREHRQRIVEARHHDPFGYLGMHDHGKKLVVRAFHPYARTVSVVERLGKKNRYPLKRIDESGLFAGAMGRRRKPFPYELEVEDHDGSRRTQCDPYAFLPVITDYDLHLFNEGNHYEIHEKLGAHPMELDGVAGVLFATWAPTAQRVSVVGDFNRWDGRVHGMRGRGSSGVWELFIPGIGAGEVYKYEIRGPQGEIFLKADPYGSATELRPKTGSIVWDLRRFTWNDADYMARRAEGDFVHSPLSIYEVHLGSWMRVPETNAVLSYRDLAHRLADHVTKLGFTHVELLPVAEHPLDESWGYQVSGYFAPTSRFGPPEDFMYFVDYLHQNGIGVILDWVPAHFPRDAHGLAWFDGSALYEHADPRQGEHRDWGTKIFNFGRHEVRNFLISNALFWLDHYHVDGLRVDAVASMLYLDYSRGEGEWIPNRYGGRENLESIEFLKHLNCVLHERHPGVLTIAEESTAWPGVSRPTYVGGLGFSLKWNMGWMHDILEFFSKDPIYRSYHHDFLTFAMLYAFHENFILALSHDEVVHGKQALLAKMPGDMWQQFANQRLLFSYMFAQPGKKLIFQGMEFGQWNEWYQGRSVDWHLLHYPLHQGLMTVITDLNRLHRTEAALHEMDFDGAGFSWINFSDTHNNIVSFIRKGRDQADHIVCVFNCTPVTREGYRIGVPEHRYYQEIYNSDSEMYGGGNVGNRGGVHSDWLPWHGYPHSLNITLPPLAAVYFKPA